MRLSSLRLKDFRNYDSAELSFCDRINFIHGLNGQGKTSILEAIYYLSLSKSFRTQDDLTVIRLDAPYFDIEGLICEDQGSLENHVRVVAHRTDGKSVIVDRKRLDRLVDLVGRFPAVVSAPEDVLVLSGPPSGRRRWLDIAISQVNGVYLKDLQIYRQALKQRNALLLEPSFHAGTLDIWDKELGQTGARLIRARRTYLAALGPYAVEVYRGIADVDLDVQLEYRSSVSCDGDSNIEQAFVEQLAQARSRDLVRKTSTVGPHKDEIGFGLGGKLFKDYASQGQFKTMAVALRFAEFLKMVNEHDRVPMLLLDDVFAELDVNRRSHLMQYLEKARQVFVTGTESWEQQPKGIEIRRFNVHRARVMAEA